MKQFSLIKLVFLMALFVLCPMVQTAAADDTNEPSLTGKKWYSTKVDYIEFFEDGTNTYIGSCTYVHDRKNDRILFYKDDNLYDYTNIFELTETRLSIGKTSFKTYTTTPPKQLCEKLEITLPFGEIYVEIGTKVQIPIVISPDYADDKSVTLYSYDSSIAKAEGEYMIGVSPGTTTVKVTTNDGSNLEAIFKVIVPEKVDPNDTYKLDKYTYPMIKPVDLGLPSGTLWADMNLGADAPYKMSKGFKGFEGMIDVAPYVGSDWQYPTEAEFKELIDNCDLEFEEEYSDFYGSIRMGYPDYYPLCSAVFTSRTNGNKLHLYAYTCAAGGALFFLYPYSLEDGNTFSIFDIVKEYVWKSYYYIGGYEPKNNVLIRLVKRGQDGTSMKDVVTMSEDYSDAAPYFDLQGRRLMGKPSRGLYIQDGKKYLVK